MCARRRRRAGVRLGWAGWAAVLAALVAPLAGLGAPIYFDYAAPCVDEAPGGGCASFGLAEGDLITGTLTLDESLFVPGSTVDLFGHAGTALSLTIGTTTADLSNFFASPRTGFEVTFDATGSSLLCISGTFDGSCPIEDGVFLVAGSAELGLGANRIGGFHERVWLSAESSGTWTRRAGPAIPEPGGAVVFGTGALLAAGSARRRRV